jgi:hypothetical protein
MKHLWTVYLALPLALLFALPAASAAPTDPGTLSGHNAVFPSRGQ